MDLIKFTVNSSVSTVRNQQLLKSLPQISYSKASYSVVLDGQILDNIGNNKGVLEDNYKNIKLTVDFSKSSQFPIVGFIDKS
jgi:hypothetical protein